MTVWFYELQLGSFVYGEDETIQPLKLQQTDRDTAARDGSGLIDTEASH